ncbi:hypothetical protein V6N11_081321 [Hibiscus sabdariffa]|uniref:Uncharacterized protein n=1 Tax=Hibiscus sabdariffa TaxID=183260 RepID=A0ABR2QJJ9_9ROSI
MVQISEAWHMGCRISRPDLPLGLDSKAGQHLELEQVIRVRRVQVFLLGSGRSWFKLGSTSIHGESLVKEP